MIKQLNEKVTEDLCAQQVITSIVDSIKELIDNSIDAGATRIEVTLDDYGKKRVQVLDNGCGIESFEFLGQKGSTSKNKGGSGEISTLGFRGQALHSLGKVSLKMTITTTTVKQEHFSTVQFDIKAMQSQKIHPARSMTGTLVTIQQLFELLPVRRYELLNKFREHLKSIDEMIKQYSLIHPQICFILKNIREGKQEVLIETSQQQQAMSRELRWINRVGEVLGMKLTQKLIFLEMQNVCGWVLKNIESGSSKQNAYIRKNLHYMYLNQRPIDPHPKIVDSLNLYYKKYNRTTKYIFILDLILPWNTYDVNLTPNKRQILIKQKQVNKIIEQLKDFIDTNVVEDIPVLSDFTKSKNIDVSKNYEKEGSKEKGEEEEGEESGRKGCREGERKSEGIKGREGNRESEGNKEKEMEKNQRNSILPLKIKQQQNEMAFSKQKIQQNIIKRMSKEQNQGKYEKKEPKVEHRLSLIQSLNSRMSLGKKTASQAEQIKKITTNIQKDELQIQSKTIRKQQSLPLLLPLLLPTQGLLHSQKKEQIFYPELNKQIQGRLTHSLDKQAFKQFIILGQFNRGFIVCLYQQGYYLVDQHAASEKYHFEKLMNSRKNKVQIHEEIVLTPIERDNVDDFGNQLKEDGYGFTFGSSNRLVLETVPNFLGKIYGKQYFLELLERKIKLNEHPDFYNAAASRACRAAVMVGDVLQPKQMRSIVGELSNLSSPWNCPHGRPTLISLGSRKQIESITKSPQKYELE